MSESTIDLKAIWNESGVQAVLDKLDAELIGLAPVKKRIREIASLLVVDKVRRDMQLAAGAPSLQAENDVVHARMNAEFSNIRMKKAVVVDLLFMAIKVH